MRGLEGRAVLYLQTVAPSPLAWGDGGAGALLSFIRVPCYCCGVGHSGLENMHLLCRAVAIYVCYGHIKVQGTVGSHSASLDFHEVRCGLTLQLTGRAVSHAARIWGLGFKSLTSSARILVYCLRETSWA